MSVLSCIVSLLLFLPLQNGRVHYCFVLKYHAISINKRVYLRKDNIRNNFSVIVETIHLEKTNKVDNNFDIVHIKNIL